MGSRGWVQYTFRNVQAPAIIAATIVQMSGRPGLTGLAAGITKFTDVFTVRPVILQ